MGKIMLNDVQYGVGGVTDAEDVKYNSSNVKQALDDLNTDSMFKSIGNVSLRNCVGSSYIYVYEKNGDIILRYSITTTEAVAPGNSATIGTLANKRPAIVQKIPIVNIIGGSSYFGFIVIETDGTISIVNPVSNSAGSKFYASGEARYSL